MQGGTNQDRQQSDPAGNDPSPMRRPPSGGNREPALNLPPVITAIAVALLLVHVVRTAFLTVDLDRWAIIILAFIPARYGELAAEFPMPAAAIWSPLTYSLLHGDWMHLIVNLFWLAAFGSPVGRRLGPWRTAAIGVLGSLGGAAAHYLAFAGEFVPMIGASAVVSAFMGAAARFAFTGGSGPRLNIEGPAQSLVQSFSNPRFLVFLLVWLGINYLFGTGAIPIAGEGARIAWQAHVGGFLAGLLAFSALDRPAARH